LDNLFNNTPKITFTSSKTHPPEIQLSNPKIMEPIMVRIMSAGIVAMAHFTMKTTIDPNGILMSVTTTLLSSVDI
jgi:hypothetical protein